MDWVSAQKRPTPAGRSAAKVTPVPTCGSAGLTCEVPRKSDGAGCTSDTKPVIGLPLRQQPFSVIGARNEALSTGVPTNSLLRTTTGERAVTGTTNEQFS